MSSEQKHSWARLYSIGLDFAAVVAGLAFLGYWIDRHYKTGPWGTLICSVLGLVGGMINFIRSSIQETRALAAENDSQRRDTASPAAPEE